MGQSVDRKNQPFRNGYMLRDFKFSKDIYKQKEDKKKANEQETPQDVYEQRENEGKCKELEMSIDREYYERMRNTFIESNKTYNFFEDAGLSWDVSASIGMMVRCISLSSCPKWLGKSSQSERIRFRNN